MIALRSAGRPSQMPLFIDTATKERAELDCIKVGLETVELLADGQLRSLTPVDAANIFVAALPEEDEMEGPFETLAGLGVRERGEVVREENSLFDDGSNYFFMEGL